MKYSQWMLGTATALVLVQAAVAGPVQGENFAAVAWSNHQDLGTSVQVGDLAFSVPTGASLKGVTSPAGLQPGYLRDKPASKLVITPANTAYLSVYRLSLTELFPMPSPAIRIIGYRHSNVVATQVAGPLWDNTARSGVDINLSGFTDLERVEITSDTPIASSSVYFFVDGVQFSVDNQLGDADNDGVPDLDDAFPNNPAETTDTDGDGTGNNADLDDDGDGVPDYIDADPLDAGVNDERILPVNSAYKGATVEENQSIK